MVYLGNLYDSYESVVEFYGKTMKWTVRHGTRFNKPLSNVKWSTCTLKVLNCSAYSDELLMTLCNQTHCRTKPLQTMSDEMNMIS